MNGYALRLIARAAVNKIGNMLYDYGNSVWLASLGALGQTVLGIYQMSDLVTAICFNPFGGAIADRFSRRKVLMVTDLVCAGLCFLISFISSDQLMIGALIFANIIQAIAFAFSRPANKSYITEIVDKEEIVSYNSHLELVPQVISVSAPVLSFLVMNFADLRFTLLLDACTFFVAFALVYFLPNHEPEKESQTRLTFANIVKDIKEGLVYIRGQKEIFFLLLVASAVNFFFAAFNYLLPFSNRLYGQSGSYAVILSLGAAGSIVGAVVASKVKDSMQNLLLALLLTGLGVAVMSLPFHPYLAYSGNFICELFMTVFNIHFFSQVQTRTDKSYLGRVFSTIYTLAILFMPLGTFLMTIIPSVNRLSFLFIGLGVILLSFLSYLYQKTVQKN